jgi:hypothetical protein
MLRVCMGCVCGPTPPSPGLSDGRSPAPDRNLTTSYLLVFVVGTLALCLTPFNITTNLQ